MSDGKTAVTPVAPIENVIRIIRGQKVMFDADLATVYGVSTTRLNQQIRRNRDRFPSDFAFQLTTEEFNGLMLQTATSKTGRGGRRKLPLVFTEHGAIMAANVLRSRQALQMSVFVVRAFIRLRDSALQNVQLTQKLAELEHKVTGHDDAIQQLFKAIRQLLSPPEPPRKQIGFQVKERTAQYRVRKSKFNQ
jgi:hypothetical protein